MQLLHKVTVVSSLLFLVAMVSMSSIASNVYAQAEPQFSAPRGVAVDSSGNVFVVDSGNERIQKFSNTGDFIRMWGSHCDIFGGNECNGQFDQPRGIAVDSSGNVFVADTGNNRIQKFIKYWFLHQKMGLIKVMVMGNSERYTRVAVDSSGNVFVTDVAIIVFKSFQILVHSSENGVLSVAAMGNSQIRSVSQLIRDQGNKMCLYLILRMIIFKSFQILVHSSENGALSVQVMGNSVTQTMSQLIPRVMCL